MIAKPSDMTPVMDLTVERGTGPVRTRRPIYVDLLPPCNHAGPACPHPGLPAAAGGSDAGNSSNRGDGREDRARLQGGRRTRRDAGRQVRCCVHRAHIGKHVEIPARDAVRVLDAVSLLRDVTTGETPRLGRRVIIYGGGNTAMDAARTVRRLGADEALIVYRRDRAHMPAHSFEADESFECDNCYAACPTDAIIKLGPGQRVDFANMRGVQFLEPVFESSGACAGCSETPYLKLPSQLYGDRALIANATGCSSICGGNLSVTPWSKNHTRQQGNQWMRRSA
jgi:ferredoxin